MKRSAYAFIRDDGSFLIDTNFESEVDAWDVGLGWPSQAEIDAAKAKGARVVWLDVEIPEAKP